MSLIGRAEPLVPSAVSAAACAHCGAPLAAGQHRFCCTGCEGAHALVAGLGLDAFYRRRETEAGALRPEETAPGLDLAPFVTTDRDGTQRLELLLSGLTCGACVWLVEQALAAEPDVLSARASLTARQLTVTWRGEAARANDVVALLARLGFRAAPWSPACLRATEDAEGRELTLALGVAAFGSMNVMLVSVAVWVGWDMGPALRHALHWLAAMIGLPVVLIAGMPFYRSAWTAIRAGRPSMDLAVSLGVLATTAMSLSETLRNGPYTWFDGATMLLALLLAGRVFDRAARRRARQSVAELLALQEGVVSRLLPDGRMEAVPAENIAAGDRVLVAAGERLRLDGVADADALLDAAATTGESVPRTFAAGDSLPAGAVNMGAAFAMMVTAAAKDGSLAAMARLLERAEQAKGRFVAIADRASRYYVPVVHAVAALTFLGWWGLLDAPWQVALVNAVCVLLITCPCALALAVPAVQVVAVGALFRRGVLVTSATALERLASADHAVLDKTGTLTEGRPVLVPEGQDAGTLRRAAGMARASRHPLAQALARACPDAALAEGVREVPGQGLLAGEARLGSPAFCGLGPSADGMTMVFRDGDGAPVAFRFADRMRDDAPAAVAALNGLGLPAELLSGDGEGAVASLARRAGIPAWRSSADPVAKQARIEALKAEGRHPLMVGDGINDAAALAAAHVSASPAGATDLAQTAADLVLQREGLAALPAAIRVARRAQAIARQNIGLSLTYNVFAVPAAVGGLVTPLIAALVMAASSIVVVLNALRAGKE
ncbi:heavy metal translocating P-type ATPase [Neoroseomonas soli]|uniref:Cadmium-translocating P-type ATPase n=1 Tax=Neoroseomonas soli TaxID=1081025 RepID=A0A9X9X244_9PROT|nr:heavy metal translocating P-type ATPase metal-binding domain-containing protein [Neoroseomonas soli]MBR0673473.1 cadmium-translocating P-type ATPase [Neoroseomonas soli]